MNIINVFTVGAILGLLISGGAAFYYYRKRNLEKFFNQIYEEVKKVPKQKKNSFLLLMFKESLSASINKSNTNSFANKLQNRKYLDFQLAQMSNILKDSSKVQDKLIKRSLNLLKDYQTWEKARISKDTKVAQDKAS
ncbi:hypothetical protein [Clostridium formicaceticum]|uniref:Uncharacterized protein n=1 Tax=Clostridium formicaceticum TaxID=1497 RepID=A0AAC9RPN8_9CLOT|nr:hypothetical protein [Clostridium formicaceticum]AOY74625.1 hypothetical protein BJL90_00825 [Clostridium formicaceticum]ARE88990.1 hypothetical protein CLFO_33960 [Clostridium formicaceticum]